MNGFNNIYNEHSILSIVHAADLNFHLFDSFFQIHHFFSQIILVLAEVMCIFLHSLKECLIVGDGFVDIFFILVEIFFVNLPQVIKIAVDAFI